MAISSIRTTIKYNICLLGDNGVGKTSLLRTFSYQKIPVEHLETYGVDIGLRSFIYHNYSIRFHICGIPCHHKYEQVRKTYYHDAQTAIIIYDVSDTNMNLYDRIIYWAEEFWINNGKGVIPIILAGNKIDLRKEHIDTITYFEGKKLAEKISSEKGVEVSFIEISAKTRKNISKTVELLAGLLFQSSTLLTEKIHNNYY